jgi:DNA-binding NarL/FixJ family response regulator
MSVDLVTPSERPGRGPRPGRPCPACGALVPPYVAEAVLLAPGLSARQRAVFRLLGLGYDNRSIARVLDISERTVKRHVSGILSSLRLESRLQAGLAALTYFSGSS